MWAEVWSQEKKQKKEIPNPGVEPGAAGRKGFNPDQ
jgi:hypothetical protein